MQEKKTRLREDNEFIENVKVWPMVLENQEDAEWYFFFGVVFLEWYFWVDEVIEITLVNYIGESAFLLAPKIQVPNLSSVRYWLTDPSKNSQLSFDCFSYLPWKF